MKLVRNLVFAGLLVFTVTVNIFAGETQTPNVVPPPPDRIVASEDGGVPSIDPYTGELTAETTDYLFFEALAAVLSIY